MIITNQTTNITNKFLKRQLTFRNSTEGSDVKENQASQSLKTDTFEKKILEQNNKFLLAISLLTIAAFIKVGIDLLQKNTKALNPQNNAIFREFKSLKNNKNIPTVENCNSINKDLKQVLTTQLAHIKAGTDLINETGCPQASNRLLLCGPAGVGKSFFAKIFAKSLDAEYKEILYSDFNSRYIGEHLENLTVMFEDILREASNNPKKRYVLTFNEVDTLLNPIGKLSDSTVKSNYGTFKIEERSIFLNYLELLREKTPNVTIIGTTNILPKSKNMDQSVLSRFQNIIEVPYPDKDCLYEAIKMKLDYLPNKETFLAANDIELRTLAEKMENRKFSFRNLDYIINDAKSLHLSDKSKNKNKIFDIEYLKKGEQNLKFSDGEIEPAI